MMIKVNAGQFYVVLAESDTGIAVASDGKRNINSDVPRIVFECFEDAKAYGNQIVVKMPGIERSIYNGKSEFIDAVRSK